MSCALTQQLTKAVLLKQDKICLYLVSDQKCQLKFSSTEMLLFWSFLVLYFCSYYHQVVSCAALPTCLVRGGGEGFYMFPLFLQYQNMSKNSVVVRKWGMIRKPEKEKKSPKIFNILLEQLILQVCRKVSWRWYCLIWKLLSSYLKYFSSWSH